MFTGPVGPVEVFFYWPEAVFDNFYWPGAIGSPLASSPVLAKVVDALIWWISRQDWINPFTPVALKTAWPIWSYLSNKYNFHKIFDGERFLENIQQIPSNSSQVIINSKVIFKSIVGTDDTCQWELQAWMG